jgi:hypothetical protein
MNILTVPAIIFGCGVTIVNVEATEAKRNLASKASKLHELFVQHFQGGEAAFQESIRERSDWSPLQLMEYNRIEQWGNGPKRFDALGPVIPCPAPIFESFGQGDGEKRICGSMIDDACVVISIGSHNDWDFEVAIAQKYPNCRIHTLDCFIPCKVPAAITSQVTFHPICLGVEDATIEGRQFMSWLTLSKELGLTKPPTAMKMDIEGYEWTTIPAIIKSNVHVPESFSFELHYATSVEQVPWAGRFKVDPELGLFTELLYSFGYVLVDRNDNPGCGSCSEVVMAKLLPNTRFLHHSSAALQSNFATNGTHEKLLKIDPFPTLPH